MREIAQALKLQISKVDDAIVDAAIKGIVSAPAVYRAAKDFLMNEVINKNCEDFLSPPVSCLLFHVYLIKLFFSISTGINCLKNPLGKETFYLLVTELDISTSSKP